MNMEKKTLDFGEADHYSSLRNATKLLKICGEIMDYHEKYLKYALLLTVSLETTGIEEIMQAYNLS
jgi:hypothetical protein